MGAFGGWILHPLRDGQGSGVYATDDADTGQNIIS